MAATSHKVRLTLEQLKEYNGEDNKPVYLALRGKIYDVTKGKDFYGPGGPYNAFAGRECARSLALMQISVDERSGDISDLDDSQLKVLEDWEAKLAGKYGVVGEVVLAGQTSLQPGQATVLRPARMMWTVAALFLFLSLLVAFFLNRNQASFS